MTDSGTYLYPGADSHQEDPGTGKLIDVRRRQQRINCIDFAKNKDIAEDNDPFAVSFSFCEYFRRLCNESGNCAGFG